MAEVLEAAEWGTLGLVSAEGRPVLVPLNFVWYQGRIYFHGSASGEKMDIIRNRGEATFLVVDAFSQIPSYATDPSGACAATQFYKSVILYGRVGLVEDRARKAEALEALMKKLQPEGGYEAISADAQRYQAGVAGVTVLEMIVDRMSGKFAFGQMFSAEKRASIVAMLQTRRGPQDQRTLEAMARFASPR
jgi:hypothetical protein